VIEDVVERWHRLVRGDSDEGLAGLLADDVVFYSPIVYTPQRGRDVTMLYLQAAMATLPGDMTDDGMRSFRYTKQVAAGDTAVLEFETQVNGKYVNGVDIIRCDDNGRIVEFRVMIRPLQAVNLVHDQMRAMLASLQG
jgi:ketosteroid isomerase-like protein